MSLINSKEIRRSVAPFLLLCFLCILCVAQPARAAVDVVSSAKTAAAGEWKTTAKGLRYCFVQTGKYAKNSWRKIDGSIYRFDKNGYVVTGWIKFKNKMYYAGSDGKLYVSSWVKSGGKKYYVDKTGVRLQNVWIRDNGKFYYLGSTGAMAVKQWVDGGQYYVGANGARKTDCVVNGYYLDSSGKKTVKAFDGDYIFVGDSRTVGMQMAASPADTKYIAKISMGYAWLESTAGPELRGYLDQNPDVSVVLAFGVNDLANVQKYISYYKKLIKKYPETRFYVEAITPVNEKIEAAHGYSVKNKQIVSFNKTMRAAVGKSRFLNTYAYLKKKGFQTSDGLHYTIADYSSLYNYIISLIKK